MSVFADVLAKVASDPAAAAELGALAKEQGVATVISAKLMADLEKLAGTPGKDGKAREGALLSLAAVVEAMGTSVEPLAVALYPTIFDKLGDKVRAARCGLRACKGESHECV